MNTISFSPFVNVLLNFMNDYHLQNAAADMVSFNAVVDLVVNGRKLSAASKVLIKKIEGGIGYTVRLLNNKLNSILPVELNTKNDTFIYFENEYLFIAGQGDVGGYTLMILPDVKDEPNK